MIVIDILHNIFEILPQLILGAGPFCVFKGMGTGKDSGKLLFKKLYTDTGVNITETLNILDFSVSGGGPPPDPIDTCEIAYGTGTGITSSVWYVDGVTNRCGLFGARVISTYNSNNSNLSIDCGNLIVGGLSNYIFDTYSENSLIVGGQANQLLNYGSNQTFKQSVILGGYNACTRGYGGVYSENNIIISAQSYMYGGSNNFHSGCTVFKNNFNSSLMGVNKFSKIENSSRSQVILGGAIYGPKQLSIQNGNKNKNYGLYNSIFNGNVNIIACKVGVRPYQKYPPYHSSIVNGKNNRLDSGSYNTILNGRLNNIQSNYYIPVGVPWEYQWPNYNSTILTGRENLITIGCNSAILNGYRNEIFVSNYLNPHSPNGINCSSNNVIFSGKNNKINWGSNNVSLYNNSGSINRSFRSKLSGDLNNFNADGATASNNNIIAGGCLNKVSNSVILAGVSEANSKILGSFSTSTFDTSSSNFLSGRGTIQGNCDHNNNVLINFTGNDSQIKYANRSTIIGGNLSCIIANGTGSVTSAVILNSFDSKIVAADGCCISDSVIISGTSSGLSHSYKSAIISSFQSRIEGGSLNTILNSSNSIIGRDTKSAEAQQGNGPQSCMVSIISSNNFSHCIPSAGMGSTKNSVIIGLTGGSIRDTSCFTILGNLHILGTVSWQNGDGSGKVDGVWFCQIALSTITQLVVCNGIVTSII